MRKRREAKVVNVVKCEDCVYMYRCERTYLGECDCGVSWDNAYIVDIGAIGVKEKDGDEV